MRRWNQVLLGCLGAVAMIAGCDEKAGKVTDMSAMKPPPRPTELDQLESWVGNWTMTGEGNFGGKAMKSTGRVSTGWEADRRALVAKGDEEVEGMGKNSMLEVYTWNPKAKRFNAHYFSSMGDESHGEMTYNAANKTYSIRAKGPDPMSGKTVIFEGNARVLDPNTFEWKWEIWDSMHMSKMGDGKGTMKRA